MSRKASSDETALIGTSKIIIFAAVLVGYGSNFWPGRRVAGFGLKALGNPPYAGFVGAFLPHLLLYSTLMAVVCAALWWLLVQAKLLPPLQLSNFKTSVLLGLLGGLGALLLTLAVVAAAFPAGTIHWISPAPWKIAGNLFSNFFEEFVFRGFILVALQRIAGFWSAALLSSAMWAFLHSQFPLVLQCCIWVIGVGFCVLARRAKSLLAPYFAHEVLDLIADSLIG